MKEMHWSLDRAPFNRIFLLPWKVCEVHYAEHLSHALAFTFTMCEGANGAQHGHYDSAMNKWVACWLHVQPLTLQMKMGSWFLQIFLVNPSLF